MEKGVSGGGLKRKRDDKGLEFEKSKSRTVVKTTRCHGVDAIRVAVELPLSLWL